MIKGLGIDFVDVAEIQQNIDSNGQYLERIFTASEIQYSKDSGDPYQRLAARFAAKEATMKALGTGWDQGVQWREIEVFNDLSGRPMLRMYGHTAEISRRMGVRRVWVSLSHTPSHAIAEVVLED
jgi:holo-[acyl-carrier protein] synthase